MDAQALSPCPRLACGPVQALKDNPIMLKLGVNVDHVATLRQARYRGKDTGEPDPVAAALICEKAGAHGITAHLREDRRHMQDDDLRRLREVVTTRLNMELANTPEMVEFAMELQPDVVCFVPENRHEITTEGGLDVAGHFASMQESLSRMRDRGIEVSLFIDPDPIQVEAAAKLSSDFVELHTGAYSETFNQKGLRNAELERLVSAAELAHRSGLRVNAGHGLNYQNLSVLHVVPHLVELNIGHSIISRSVVTGLEQAVQDMLKLMMGYGPAGNIESA